MRAGIAVGDGSRKSHERRVTVVKLCLLRVEIKKAVWKRVHIRESHS